MTDSLESFKTQCPNCGSTNLDEEWEDIDAVCSACGFVIHSYENPDSHLTSQNRGNRHGTGADQTTRWEDHHTVTNSTEQRIASAFESLEEIGDALHLSNDARKRAASMFATLAKKNLVDGRSTEVVVATTLYFAARQVECPRPLARIAEEIDTEPNKIDRLSRSLRSELDFEFKSCTPKDYLPYLCKELGYEESVEDEARTLCAKAEESGLTNGKSPVGVAGAVLYLVGDKSETQQEMAATVGVSKETIRLRLKEFRDGGLVDD